MTKPDDVVAPERRVTDDRRARRTPPLSFYWLRGRRKAVRRHGDIGTGYYVDRPGAATLTAAGVLILLSLLDGGLTLELIRRGASEANPVMAFFLSFGTTGFLAAKYGVTLAGVAMLLIHQNFTLGCSWLRVKWILVALLGTHGALVGYETALLDAHSPAAFGWTVEPEAGMGRP